MNAIAGNVTDVSYWLHLLFHILYNGVSSRRRWNLDNIACSCRPKHLVAILART